MVFIKVMKGKTKQKPKGSVPSAKEPFEKTIIERRDLRPDDILIDIKYCGICHSDIHNAHNDVYPMVPGHEIGFLNDK